MESIEKMIEKSRGLFGINQTVQKQNKKIKISSNSSFKNNQ